MLKATIHFDAYLDDYEQGELDHANYWMETLEAETAEELKAKILEATYTASWADVSDDQINEYDWCTEYSTSYLADEDNQGDASKSQIEQWKLGKLKLYAINCQILVTEVTEKKAEL